MIREALNSLRDTIVANNPDDQDAQRREFAVAYQTLLNSRISPSVEQQRIYCYYDDNSQAITEQTNMVCLPSTVSDAEVAEACYRFVCMYHGEPRENIELLRLVRHVDHTDDEIEIDMNTL